MIKDFYATISFPLVKRLFKNAMNAIKMQNATNCLLRLERKMHSNNAIK